MKPPIPTSSARTVKRCSAAPLPACRGGRADAASKAISQNLFQIIDAATAADRPLAFGRRARKVGLLGLVVHELAAGLGEQMNARRKAAGHQHQIARDGFGFPKTASAGGTGKVRRM